MRKFIESPLARNQRRLEKLTLNESHFKSMFMKMQDDLDIHTWGQFAKRAEALGKRVEHELKECPYFQKTVELVMKMKMLIEKERQVSDLGEADNWKEWTEWWNEKKFENPFKGMDLDDDLMLI